MWVGTTVKAHATPSGVKVARSSRTKVPVRPATVPVRSWMPVQKPVVGAEPSSGTVYAMVYAQVVRVASMAPE